MLGPQGLGSYVAENGSLLPSEQPAESVLVPGFVDIHIHGAFGVDTLDANPQAMQGMCEHLRRCGYEGFLATTITSSLDKVKAAINALPENPMILGVHLEGPFISPEFPGAQPQSAILDPESHAKNWEDIFDHPQLKLVTLAPERPGALDLIRRLTSQSKIVSLGHTSATEEQARQAFAAGATHVTHCFNAMRSLHHREVGLLGYALSNPEMACELIYDRNHVSTAATGILMQLKPKDKVLAVSDGTLSIGAPAGTAVGMWGQACRVLEGKVVLEGTQTLAGSCITLRDAFVNLWNDFGLELAIRACCLNPRAALGMTEQPKIWVEFSLQGEIVAIYDAA